MLLPNICRRVGAQTLLIPLIDMYSPADISALSVVLPAQFSCFFSGTSLLILNQGMPQWPGRIYHFLGKTSQNGKDCKKFSRAIWICSHASTEKQCFVKQNWQPTTPCVSHLYTLVHIIPLLKSPAVKIQPTKCTSIFLQSNLTKSSRDEGDTILDLVILLSDKYPKTLLYMSIRRNMQKILIVSLSERSRNQKQTECLTRELILKLWYIGTHWNTMQQWKWTRSAHENSSSIFRKRW